MQTIRETKGRVRYFFDTEFYENGVTIDLISIGVVCSDGREYYAVSRDAQLHRVSPWVREHVLPHLPPYSDEAWSPRITIRQQLEEFVRTGDDNEFWGYYADYDWVVLCQLFGTMMDLPKHFPKYAMDLKQYALMLGNPQLPVQVGTEHNALEDARWNRYAYKFLTEYT
jgi:hypothetical protein